MASEYGHIVRPRLVVGQRRPRGRNRVTPRRPHPAPRPLALEVGAGGAWVGWPRRRARVEPLHRAPQVPHVLVHLIVRAFVPRLHASGPGNSGFAATQRTDGPFPTSENFEKML